MIWYICFVSLTNLFEIQLFSSYIHHPLSSQYSYISWIDNTHKHLFIEPNKTNSRYINKCHKKINYLIARCFLIKNNFNQTYKCFPVQQDDYLKNRLKREVTGNKSKRSLHIILLIIIGILCFIVGIVVGIFSTVYISIKRQKKREDEHQRYKVNKPIEPVIKTFGINNEILKRLRQNKVSPTYNSTSNQSPEIPDHTPIILQDQSLTREQTDQGMLLSKLVYKVPFNNMSTNFSKIEIPMEQQYRPSKNIKNHIRSKSC